MRIGVIAAMPGELKPLVRGWRKMPVAHGSGIAMWEKESVGDEWVAVCAGMGAAAARRAFTAAEFAGSLDEVVSIGWAGALTEAMRPGTCSGVGEVIDAQTGERFGLETAGTRLVTTIGVAGPREKQRLAASYGADLVDMEGAVVARLAQMRGIPMHCFKGVSDGVEADLPDLNPFIDVDGKLRMAALLGHVALRPRYWPALMHMGKNSGAAAEAMAYVAAKYLKRETGA